MKHSSSTINNKNNKTYIHDYLDIKATLYVFPR